MPTADEPTLPRHEASESQALRQTLGELAHDLNNLLGLIGNHAQLLRFLVDDRQKVLHTADRILETALRGAALTARLQALREPPSA